jgi:hypothetical protein
VLTACTSRFFRKHEETAQHGNYAYELPPAELLKMKALAESGDCDASYRVGRHHLYVSLNYDEAARYFRIANKCPNVGAKLGLITVLRGPEHDAEVDSILLSLRDLDAAAWKDATEEVANRKTYR